MKRVVHVIVIATVLFWSTLAAARSFRPNQVPSNPFSSSDPCLLCHMGMGGGPRKAFGQDVESTLTGSPISQADVDWQAVCPMDSDGDGYTNGEELGDPNCNWMVGDPQLNFDATDPNDPSDPSCGNNVAAGPEVCDGSDLKNTTCSDLGAGTGTPTCNNSCTGFLTTTCSPASDTGTDTGTAADTGVQDTGADATSDASLMDVLTDTSTALDARSDTRSDTGDDTAGDTRLDVDPMDVTPDTSEDTSGVDTHDASDTMTTAPDATPDAQDPSDTSDPDGGARADSTDSGCGCRSQPGGSAPLWIIMAVFIWAIRPRSRV